MKIMYVPKVKDLASRAKEKYFMTVLTEKNTIKRLSTNDLCYWHALVYHKQCCACIHQCENSSAIHYRRRGRMLHAISSISRSISWQKLCIPPNQWLSTGNQLSHLPWNRTRRKRSFIHTFHWDCAILSIGTISNIFIHTTKPPIENDERLLKILYSFFT